MFTLEHAECQAAVRPPAPQRVLPDDDVVLRVGHQPEHHAPPAERFGKPELIKIDQQHRHQPAPCAKPWGQDVAKHVSEGPAPGKH